MHKNSKKKHPYDLRYMEEGDEGIGSLTGQGTSIKTHILRDGTTTVKIDGKLTD